MALFEGKQIYPASLNEIRKMFPPPDESHHTLSDGSEEDGLAFETKTIRKETHRGKKKREIKFEPEGIHEKGKSQQLSLGHYFFGRKISHHYGEIPYCK